MQHRDGILLGSQLPCRTCGGFTLLEVMMVVVIVGILAAIALPNYSQYVQRTRRIDAKNLLLAAAARQEQFMLDRRTYTTDMRELGYASDPAVSEEGFYTVDGAVGGCGNIARCFTLTATPVAGRSQANDSQCTAFSVTSAGQRTATGSLGNDCW